MLATGADAQVRQRQIASRQTGLQQIRGDVFRTQVPGLNFPRQTLSGLRDIPLATVVGGDLQDETVGASGHVLGFTHGGLKLRMKPRTVTDDSQADVVVIEALGLTPQCLEEQIHQGTDLIGRALPVLTGEREQGQYLDP
ncbi:hypothetical protein D3C87_1389640 [compost metagenome]